MTKQEMIELLNKQGKLASEEKVIMALTEAGAWMGIKACALDVHSKSREENNSKSESDNGRKESQQNV